MGGKKYPVFFSASHTSGEKAFEEFYTEREKIDISRLSSIGVIIEKKKVDKTRVDELISKMDRAFDDNRCSKEMIIIIISDYLPNFKHIETGRSLDSKM